MFPLFKVTRKSKNDYRERKKTASAGNRTRINCLEGSYADHYTTDALL